MYRFVAIFSVSLLLFVSCRDNRPEYGFVRLVFQHQWNESPMQIDGITQYTNAAGNILTFHRLYYIISDLTISGSPASRGGIVVRHPEVHFIDRDTTILLTYQIPVGQYNSIGFIFGLDEKRNITGMFPEISRMDWGVPRGGGYHYMMFDGWWASSEGPRPANLHLGALEEIFRIDTVWGFNEETEAWDIIIRIDTIFAKYHNFLRVTLPRSFTVDPNTITTIEPIIMDVDQWFKNPRVWDFNVMGYGCIMSKRYAMDSLAINGANGVFRGSSVIRGNNTVFRTVSR